MKNKHVFNSKKIICLLPWFLSAVLFIGLIVVCIHEQYPSKIISKFQSKLFHVENASDYYDTNRIADPWYNCLSQMNYNADIVFLGDSITALSNFNTYFPDKNICNLGRSGDTISDIYNRIYAVDTVNPDKIFLMCGINSIKRDNLDEQAKIYDNIVNSLLNCTDEIYVCSVLPIGTDGEQLTNNDIVIFNSKIKAISEKYSVTYVDIHSAYIDESGNMNPSYSMDGCHLFPEAYSIWADIIKSHIY